jgi:hypothetical protein
VIESFNIYLIIPQIAQAEQPNHRTQKRYIMLDTYMYVHVNILIWEVERQMRITNINWNYGYITLNINLKKYTDIEKKYRITILSDWQFWYKRWRVSELNCIRDRTTMTSRGILIYKHESLSGLRKFPLAVRFFTDIKLPHGLSKFPIRINSAGMYDYIMYTNLLYLYNVLLWCT